MPFIGCAASGRSPPYTGFLLWLRTLIWAPFPDAAITVRLKLGGLAIWRRGSGSIMGPGVGGAAGVGFLQQATDGRVPNQISSALSGALLIVVFVAGRSVSLHVTKS